MTKPNIFLDLDNTVISSVPLEEISTIKKFNAKSDLFSYYIMDDYYVVFERPYLQHFLDFLFKHFNVSVWSAASKNYVLSIVNNVILKNPNRKLQHILFSYHCSLSKKYKKGAVKKLQMLWDDLKLNPYNQENTIIIDDLNNVKEHQPDNCYHIEEFEFKHSNSHKDRELLKLIKYLKNSLN
jgi:TFIIF-interacting CTD phosphatase-like protein